MRILIEGLDLSGKTTLCRALVNELNASKQPVQVNRGFLSQRNPVSFILPLMPAPRHSASRVLGGLYILGALLDRMISPPPRGVTLIQESYIDRSLAYGAAQGWRISRLWLGLVHLFPRFDLAVYLFASLETRRQRSRLRTDLNAVDQVTLSDTFSPNAHQAALVAASSRHSQALFFDTDSQHLESIVESVVSELSWIKGSTRKGTKTER